MTVNMTMMTAMLTMSTVLKTITIHYFSSEKATTWLFGKLPSPSSWGRIPKMVDHNLISEYLPTLYPNWLTTIWTPTHILLLPGDRLLLPAPLLATEPAPPPAFSGETLPHPGPSGSWEEASARNKPPQHQELHPTVGAFTRPCAWRHHNRVENAGHCQARFNTPHT